MGTNLKMAQALLELGATASFIRNSRVYIDLAAAAREAEERARLRVELTQASLDEANRLLESEKLRTTALEEQLQRERLEYEDQKAYLRSDYEELRGRVLHRLRQEVTLLDEGLHALRKQPPKVHVMEDHAERAIDGLKKEIARIKGEAE